MTWSGQLKASAAAPFGWIRQHWDAVLLGAMIVIMAGLAAYLISPRPDYTLTLSSVPQGAFQEGLPGAAKTAMTEADEELLAAPADDHPSRRHRADGKKAKKPAKPPVMNLNTATAPQLDLLPGVGPKLAKRILDYRKSHGPFTDIAQIMEVKGIGEKNFAKMRPFLKL